ncbi:CLUMA_CG009792, isoform A [Clunio marinus]|uniref:CLUMA_CG009792, isoform A n=1 Tax=Clunio marinus TaxID=568069 RepID=A0A1J1I7T5_9DIPT|nr:CLUMA_CG009792, isoform A [Clunio marinus]
MFSCKIRTLSDKIFADFVLHWDEGNVWEVLFIQSQCSSSNDVIMTICDLIFYRCSFRIPEHTTWSCLGLSSQA